MSSIKKSQKNLEKSNCYLLVKKLLFNVFDIQGYFEILDQTLEISLWENDFFEFFRIIRLWHVTDVFL